MGGVGGLREGIFPDPLTSLSFQPGSYARGGGGGGGGGGLMLIKDHYIHDHKLYRLGSVARRGR